MLRARKILAAAAGLLALPSWGSAATSAAAPSSREEALISAAVVYNIARFSSWPSEPDVRFFEVCYDADEGMDDAFATIAGKEVAGKPVRPVPVHGEAMLGRCHVYFTERRADERTLQLASERGSLTVGRDGGFLRRGGAVRLRIDGRPRFSVNVRSARTAGVSPSSKLLRLAEEVIE